ncbi:MAG: ABC transporter permease [Proteobacteria bacterium]|nr:ABC transporter permease [Pseudomonadota bacterium]
MLTAIRAILIKEFLSVWRDKKTRMVLIMPPLLQLFLFSFAATLEVKNTTISILNEDQGPVARELVQRISASPRLIRKVLNPDNTQDIESHINNQKALVGIHFPSDFSRRVMNGESGKFQVILDGRRSNTASIMTGYLNEIVNTYNQEFAKERGVLLAPSTLVVRHWFNPNLEYMWFTLPCLVAILGQVIALSLTSLAIARERELGTFEQLLVSPVSSIQILTGKTLPALGLAFLESYVILFLVVFFFGVEFQGSLMLFFWSMLIFLLSIVGIGLFISSMCKTQQQVVLGTFVYMVPAVTISGFATPVENMPMFLQYLSELSPLKHFLIVSKGLFLKDLPAPLVAQYTWPNFLIALCTLMAALWLFRRRME